MGRRPNPLILEFFERGAKLNDNSNRYHHRCKACGEDFPKGRIDSLTNHLTKKCPAISEADRINACLALHGISHASGRPKYDGLLHSGPNMGPNTATGMVIHDAGRHDTSFLVDHHDHHDHHDHGHHHHDQSLNHSLNHSQSQIWTPLETLAEVSRQIEANEKHDDHMSLDVHDSASEAVQTTLAAAIPNLAPPGSDHFELQEQYTLENPPMSYGGGQPQHEKKDDTPQKTAEFVHHDPPIEEQPLHQLLESTAPPSHTALSVAAAAATARLTSSLLDPQILSEDVAADSIAQAAPTTDMVIDYPEPEKEDLNTQASQIHTAQTSHGYENAQFAPVIDIGQSTPPSSARPIESSTPWGGMTYMSDDIHGPAIATDHAHQLGPNLKGGYRMDTTTSPDGSHQKHSRAKYDKDRRIEVQEIRRMGACIRCRILRKVCSKGQPCDTCKKVLSPRVWRTGCIRTKLSEFIDLYSAGVQVVMTQKRLNSYKTSYVMENAGAMVEASHFPESGHTVLFQVFQGYPKEAEESDVKSVSQTPVIFLDNDKEDIPGKVEIYMRSMLPYYITNEPSPYVRTTLEVADQIVKATNDELLKRSLELWGIVEMMDRERQWMMLAKFPQSEVEDHWIKDDTESEAYSNICMQLTAAAERKASVGSKHLLNGIQRSLQDGKTKLGFPMFLTVMLFLNCLEKTTWAFKAWDQENLRPKWPLERPPQSYTNQGHGLTELLRMLLVIRHVLPKTNQSDHDAPITADSEGPDVKRYFQDLNVTPRYLRTRYHDNNFQPTDSRSLEFLFCAQLLLHAPPAHAVLHPIPHGPPLHAAPPQPSQEPLQQTFSEGHQEMSQDPAQEMSRESPQERALETGHERAEETYQEAPSNPPSITSQDVHATEPREIAQDA